MTTIPSTGELFMQLFKPVRLTLRVPYYKELMPEDYDGRRPLDGEVTLETLLDGHVVDKGNHSNSHYLNLDHLKVPVQFELGGDHGEVRDEILTQIESVAAQYLNENVLVYCWIYVSIRDISKKTNFNARGWQGDEFYRIDRVQVPAEFKKALIIGRMDIDPYNLLGKDEQRLFDLAEEARSKQYEAERAQPALQAAVDAFALFQAELEQRSRA
jgi:hypothetical protein